MTVDHLDAVLTLQLVVAWAGEQGETPRLGWWRTDMISEFGGEDLFRRLLPHTWRWAVFEAAREAARRVDDAIRSRCHDPDRLVSLYRFGFEADERMANHLYVLKSSGATPQEALPELARVTESWDQQAFAVWLAGMGPTTTQAVPSGRLVAGPCPSAVHETARRLAAALVPLHTSYPFPHFVSPALCAGDQD